MVYPGVVGAFGAVAVGTGVVRLHARPAGAGRLAVGLAAGHAVEVLGSCGLARLRVLELVVLVVAELAGGLAQVLLLHLHLTSRAALLRVRHLSSPPCYSSPR